MTTTATTTKMIIDTDPGIDDAMAVFFAHAHPQIELLGLTTIFGNVPTETATANALRLVDITGIDIPVCEGEKNPLVGQPRPYPDFVHGKDGFGDIGFPAAKTTLDPRKAVDFLAETISANPGEITLVPVGPLTNIGRLVNEHPQVVNKVKEVVIMGGSMFAPGNVTPLAEANIANDPEAADIVCGASWPLTVIGLDVTSKTTVKNSDFEEIAATEVSYGEFLAKISAYYIDFYSSNMNVDGCCMHDVVAVAAPVAAEIIAMKKARIRVETEGFSRGKTAAMPEDFYSHDKDWLERPLQQYAADIDQNKMLNLFVETLKSS